MTMHKRIHAVLATAGFLIADTIRMHDVPRRLHSAFRQARAYGGL